MSKTVMTELCSQPAMKLAYLNTQNLNPSILISSTTNHSLLDSTWSQYFGYDNRPTLLWLTGPSLFFKACSSTIKDKDSKMKRTTKAATSTWNMTKLFQYILKMSKDFSQVYGQKKWAKSENQRPNQCSQQSIIKVLTVLHVVQLFI